MTNAPLMPMATAVWLLENTTLTFKQIADFCNLHEVEIQGIADGEVAKGIVGYNPVIAGQLTREEIEECSKDISKSLVLNKKTLDIKSEKKVNRYVPLSKRQDRPEAILWLTKNYPQLSDGQIVKLVGSTKNTVSAIRNKKYWNTSSLTPKDPVVFNFCSDADIKKAVDKSDRKIVREKKKTERENKKIESEQKVIQKNEIEET